MEVFDGRIAINFMIRRSNIFLLKGKIIKFKYLSYLLLPKVLNNHSWKSSSGNIYFIPYVSPFRNYINKF